MEGEFNGIEISLNGNEMSLESKVGQEGSDTKRQVMENGSTTLRSQWREVSWWPDN